MTSYKPEYCQQVIDYMGSGHGIEAFGPQIGVSRQTLYNWKAKYPEFAEALETGASKRQALIESALLKHGLTGTGNAASLIFLAKNWCGMRDDFGLTDGQGQPFKLLIERYDPTSETKGNTPASKPEAGGSGSA